MRATLAALVLVLVLGGCGEGDEPAPTPPPAEPAAIAQIEMDDGEVVDVEVEVADTDAERQRGLMFRESLAPDAGMIFLFDGPQTGGFWMKDTLIPLSIAFFDGRGRIVRILDMEPCRTDPCPIYDPGVKYEGALEVNRGAFAAMGVEAGHRVTLVQPGA